MHRLILRPLGGLANRMRVIESAYNLSKNNNVELIIWWDKNEILNARYIDCFEGIPGVQIVEYNYQSGSRWLRIVNKAKDIYKSIYLNLKVANRLIDQAVEKKLIENNFDVYRLKDFFDNLFRGPKDVTIYVETCYEFYPNIHSFRVQIREQIRSSASDVIPDGNNTVGVHIRRTDHVLSILNSPTELFIQEMNLILDQSPNTKFYLSTDEDQTVEMLSQLFPEKILTGISERRRNSNIGIRAALIDMYCLSRCREILGSGSSSFSERAAIIGNKTLKCISKQEKI